MLFIDVKGFTSNFKWHVGESFPISPMECFRVESIQADGDELTHIAKHIEGIPISTSSVQAWYGPDAKFISHFLSV